MRVVLDAETTTHNKGSPFDRANKLLVVGYHKVANDNKVVDKGVLVFEYAKDVPLGESVASLRRLIEESDEVVLFNAKFDLAWFHRYGVTVPQDKRVWDCQLCEFVLSHQTPAFPSLEATCAKYGLGDKEKDITELWADKVDPYLIPLHMYVTRVMSDCELTNNLYVWQKQALTRVSARMATLISVEMEDLRALEEMEWNGQLYDTGKAEEIATEVEAEIERIGTELALLVPDAPINWNSTHHRSAVLYGGVVKWDEREEVGVFKTGEKVGQPRYRVHHREVTLPQLVKPLQGSEMEGGGWSTDADTLVTVKAKGVAKKIIELLTKRQKMAKEVGTYYRGIVELAKEMGWDDNIIHGQYNQCVAITGRLSASKPNLQNQPPANKKLFITRFPNAASQ